MKTMDIIAIVAMSLLLASIVYELFPLAKKGFKKIFK